MKGLINKSKIFVFALILAAVLFISLVAASHKLTNYSPKTKALYAINTINKGEELNESDFIEKEISLLDFNSNNVKTLEEIKGKIASETIYKNEFLNKNRLNDKSIRLFLNPDERVFSIPMKYIDDPYAGTLRKGDIVDILCTTMPNSIESYPITKTLIQQVRVVGAIDASGRQLDEDSYNIAESIQFASTIEHSLVVKNAMYTGKISIDKVPGNAEKYGDIVVVGGKINN